MQELVSGSFSEHTVIDDRFLKSLLKMDKVITSPFANILIPQKPIFEYIENMFNTFPDNKALICCDSERSYTFAEVNSKTLCLATNLLDRNVYGLKAGDVVSVLLPNVPEYAIILVACFRAGLVLAPIQELHDTSDIRKQLNFVNPKLVFCTKNTANEFKDNAERMFVGVCHDSSPRRVTTRFADLCNKSDKDSQKSLPEVAVKDVILLVPTSGTTRASKYVEITQKNLLASFAQLNVFKTQEHFEERASKVLKYLVMSPMCFIFGITNILVQLIMGYTLICFPHDMYSMTKYVEAITKFQPVVLQMLPLAIHHVIADKYVTAKEMESVKLIITGGSCIGRLSLQRFTEKFPAIKVVSGYAMTETCGPNMCRMMKVRSEDSVGVLLANTEARIVDLDSGENLGPNACGELYLRGPQVARGYFQNVSAEGDEAAAISGAAELVDEDGWLHTGDMGYFDRNQEFFVTNRVADYIKVDGKLVSPIELEDILRGHPSVKDAAVVAVENRIHGQVPKAYVSLHPGCDNYNHDLIRNFLDETVEEDHKKLLGGISVVECIPKSLGGKVNKNMLKILYSQR